MSERHALKSRLAAEIATVIFGERNVPRAAWRRLDDLVDDAFGEAPTRRLRALVDDACEVAARGGLGESAAPRSETSGGDFDWRLLQKLIDDAAAELAPNRFLDLDDEASGARTLEMVSHGCH